jgi:hypothetical protein
MAGMQGTDSNDRSALYYRSQRQALQRIQQQRQDARYTRRRSQVVGAYGGNGQGVVNGVRYRLEERGLSFNVGDTVILENAGRPGAAVYVPAPNETIEV